MKQVTLLRDTGKIDPVVTSRFRGVKILQDVTGRERYATFRFRPVPYTTSDQYHDIAAGEEGRLDLISYQYYGTVSMDWFIAVANNLPNMIQAIQPGVTLRIPSIEWWFAEGGAQI